MAKRYELRKLWGIGPFKRRKLLAAFERRITAQEVMEVKLLTAQRKGKRVTLEIVDGHTGEVLEKRKSR